MSRIGKKPISIPDGVTASVDGQTVTDQDLGLGAELGATAMSVSNTVGSAAGMAISAPIAIVDPKARGTFDAQSRRFGKGLGDSILGVTTGLSGASTRR